MRRIVVISVVVLALLACGVVVAVAAPGRKSRPISKAQAVALAHAVNLRAGDLPGYQSISPSESEPKGSNEAAECREKVHFRPVLTKVSSAFFSRSRANVVLSVVAVMPSEALARVDVAETTSSRGRSCIAREAQESIKEEMGGEASTTKVTFVPVPKMLGAGAIAVHALAWNERRRVLHEDTVAFRVGPALILLFTYGARELPVGTEDRLLSLLHSRAEAHKL